MVTRATGGNRVSRRGSFAKSVRNVKKESATPPVSNVEPVTVELVEPSGEVSGGEWLTDEGRRSEVESFREEYAKLTDTELSYQQKMDSVLKLQGKILPMLFMEAMREKPSQDRAITISRASIAIKDVAGTLKSKHDAEVSEKLNPYSSEFQFTLMWLIELFAEILKREGVGGVQSNNIFSALAVELNGFEDRILNRFKGVASRALNQVGNPFVEDFMLKVRNPAMELPMELND